MGDADPADALSVEVAAERERLREVARRVVDGLPPLDAPRRARLALLLAPDVRELK